MKSIPELTPGDLQAFTNAGGDVVYAAHIKEILAGDPPQLLLDSGGTVAVGRGWLSLRNLHTGPVDHYLVIGDMHAAWTVASALFRSQYAPFPPPAA